MSKPYVEFCYECLTLTRFASLWLAFMVPSWISVMKCIMCSSNPVKELEEVNLLGYFIVHFLIIDDRQSVYFRYLYSTLARDENATDHF